MGDLGEGLRDYQQQGFCSFHTPGHKGHREFFYDLDFCGFDLTELPGLDSLHSANGIIYQSQQRAAEVFGADETFFLVNGGTVGNQAMFLTIAGTDKQVIIERSSHRSVSSALILSGIRPNYINPVIHPDFNLPLGLNLPGSLSWSESAACHVTYPSYYGTCVNLQGLLEERDTAGSEVPVFVDQAHGSHFLGSLFPPSALKLGADLVLHSTHKTLSALTQAAMLHLRGSRVSRERLRQGLELLQSSSPSYLLLASLEKAAESALDLQHWADLQNEVAKLHQTVGGKFRLLGREDCGRYGIQSIDWSKVLVNTRPLGVSAPRCVEFLRREMGLEPELWDRENILFLLGIGNTAADIRKLAKGLERLADYSLRLESEKGWPGGFSFSESCGLPLPKQVLTPREAFLAKKRQIPLKDSLGRIVGETVSPYPPGIPIIVMGEIMTPEVLETLLNAGGRWQGWQGFESQTIWVVEEE